MQKDSFKNLPYRRCVGCFIINKDNKVFVGQRSDTKVKAWQMPQGGIDDDESPLEAAVREVYEEAGISTIELVYESKRWHYYDLPQEFIPKLWGGLYRGQKQKWFLFRFVGEDAEININLEQQEFSKWRWVSLKLLPELAISFKKQIYKSVADEFSKALNEKKL